VFTTEGGISFVRQRRTYIESAPTSRSMSSSPRPTKASERNCNRPDRQDFQAVPGMVNHGLTRPRLGPSAKLCLA